MEDKLKVKKSVKKRQVSTEPTQGIYCICRKPDNGRWMIGCDFCDDWFHGDCVDMNEDKAKLVIKYACPRCRAHTPGTWKRKCRLKSCNNPVGEMSKYCCHEHGVEFIRELVKEGVAGVTKSQLARLVQVESAEKFKNLGASNPADIKPDKENTRMDTSENEDYIAEELLNELGGIEPEKVLQVRTDRARIFKERDRLNKKSKYLKQTKEHIKRLNEELAAELNLKKKDICGLDSALMSEQWQDCEPQAQDRLKLCLNDRKKCLKHTNWHGIMVAEVELELSNLQHEDQNLVALLKDKVQYYRQKELNGL
jgi:COMPASS component SPP1